MPSFSIQIYEKTNETFLSYSLYFANIRYKGVKRCE